MATTYEAIATVTVGSGGAATIAFTSIPATYTDLCVLLSVRSDRTFYVNDSLGLEVNGSTSNRSGRVLYGNGGSAGSTTTTSEIGYAALTAAGATANTFSNILVYCPNYAGSNNKSFSSDGVSENNGAEAYTTLNAWLWSDTAAVTSLTFKSATGNNFVQYSTATLYGIKNS
jgi:hypothetical protein